MKSWQKWILGCAGFLFVLAGFIGFILPGIVRHQAIKRIEAATGRTISIGKVSINPFTWAAEVQGVRLAEKGGGATFVSFSSVRVSFSPASVWRAAPVISEARIVSPYLHLVRTAANTYNFSDLLEQKGAKKEQPGKPARFSLNNIVISNGSVDFLDRALPREKSHTVRRIEVGIPFISNIPYLADKYVLPSFSAIVNGAPLHAEGKLKPFTQARETTLDIELTNLDIPFYFAYVPGPVPVRIDSGRLTVKAEVTYRIATNAKPELNVTGKIHLANLLVRDLTDSPLIALKEGDVGIGKAAIMAREFVLSSVIADGLEVYLSRDRKGVWSHARLMEKEEQPEPRQQKALVSVAETRLANGTFHFTDALPKGGFTMLLQDISLDVKEFSTAAGKKASYTLSFASARDEKGSLKGDFTVNPLAFHSGVDLKAILLDAYYPYIAETLNAPLKGRLDFFSELAYDDSLVTADKIAVTLHDLGADFGPKEGVRFTTASLEGGHYSQKENLLEVAEFAIGGGDIRFSRGKDGSFSPVTLLKKPGTQEKKKEGTAHAGSKPFRYRMKNFAAKGLAVSFTDRKVAGDPLFTLKRANLNLKNLTWPERGPMPFSFGANYGGGTLKVAANIRPTPLVFKGEATLRRIPLTDFDPYLPEDLNLVLADGSVDTRLSFNLAQGKSGLAGNFKGELGVRNFYCLDAEHQEDLLKWESLQLEKISGTLEPFSLNVGEVSLSKYFAKVVVNKDGTLNLQKLKKPAKKEGGERKPPPTPATTAPPPTPPSGQPPPAQSKKIRIDTVSLQDGQLAFTDHHMSPEFATTIYKLGGRVSGLTSEEGKVAEVDLRGNLENQSPLTITGKINPLRDNLFLDLEVKFSDIELSPMTPYSGTFLGYSVDKGKLFLDLKYHIENKKLDSTNKIFIDQFTFGKKVESKKATNLPVRLAVALLKDRKGEIHLDLPVTGRTDDPKFSIWGVVLQILKNLLVKAATSPFALLQSAFGGKDDFSAIHFEAGSARLTDAEKEKIRKLAQALNDRPALKIEVIGFVDRERDPEGYRNELLVKKMKNEKFLALVKDKKMLGGESPDSVTIQPEEYSLYLKTVYKKEKFPKPRTVLGLVKDIPDSEMKKLILANTVVGDENFKSLARERATAVRTALVGEGKLPPERIFEKSGDIYKPPAKEGEAGNRVEFGVVAQ